MKSFTQLFLLTVVMLAFSFGFKAQVSLYTMTPISGTYSYLVGATPTSLANTADDALSAAFPIGFDFAYNGVTYTSVKASSNGLLTFNAVGSSTTANNLATTSTTARPALAPLWDDIQCSEGVKYELSGTAPNRVLTVEWRNMEWNWSSSQLAISFQVKLYEGTNIIDFVYQSETPAGNPGGSGGASIGLMGSASSDFLSLQNSSAAPTTSSTSSTNNISTKPASGQIYRFGPPPFPEVIFSSINPSTVSCTTSPARQIDLNVTISSGTVSSVILNYAFNGVAQTPINMTNTSGSNYSATIPAATPVNAVVTWNVVATANTGTTTYYNGASYQDQPWFGITGAAQANQTSVCQGADAILSMVSSNSAVQVTTQTTSNPYFSSFSYGNPFYHSTWGGLKTQHMYTAAELAATGLAAGPITDLSFIIGTAFGMTYNDFSISMGQTNNPAMAGINSTSAFTQVYSAASYTTVTGQNDFALSTPYVWDGVSNLIVQFCWSNNNGGGTNNNMLIVSSGFTCTAYFGQDNQSISTICGSTSTTGTTTTRPVMTFTGNKTLNAETYAWYVSGNPAVIGTTNPDTVSVNANTTYYAVATITGCDLTSSNVTVSTLDLPAAPIATNSTQCGIGVPTASVASAAGAAGTGDFFWYDAATSGNLVQNSSWNTQYEEDFTGPSVAPNGTLSGTANLTATPGWLQLTTNQNSQQGGFTVQPGVNGIEYQIDFDFKSNTSFGADGFSWSFAPDADATIIGNGTTLPAAEMGTGSKLKISFDAYGTSMPNQKGTYVLYNNTDATFNSTSTGVLAHTNSTPWLSTSSKHVTITISQTGLLSMLVNGAEVFTNVALPASYLTEDKSTWKHVFAARTGGVSMKNEIDNLKIQYRLTPVGVPTYNTSISSGTTLYVSELGANGCYSPLVPVVMTVTTPPQITYNNSASAICIGDAVTLNMSATITPPYTYTVTSSNPSAGVGTNATGASQTFTPTASGNVAYTITASNGTCTEMDTVTIQVVPGAAPAPIIAMDTLSLCPSATSAAFTATPSAMLIPYTFNLFDSYGDGWNGNTLKVLANGTLLESLTFTSGSFFTTTVDIPEGAVITTEWTTGSFLGECSFNIVLDGVTLHSASGLTTANLLANMYSGTAASYNYTITWYTAPTGGTLIGTGLTFDALGSAALPNLNTVGTYFVYAKQSNACLSAATQAVVNVTNVLAEITAVDATCNSVDNGTFTLGAITCGTTPFTYSVDGGSFGPIPTNLSYGSHTVVVKDATGSEAPSLTIFIDQPTWITNVPNFVANGWACKDEISEIISAANPNLTISDTLVIQSAAVVPASGNFTITSALNLPVGATVTSATLLVNGLTTSGGTWASDLDIVVSGVGSLSVTPSGFTVTNANYSYPLSAINGTNGSVTVSIDNNWFGNATIASLSLVYEYTLQQTLDNITWYAAPVGGQTLGSGFSFESVGTTVLPNTTLPGVYNFYAQGELDGCSSFTRLLVPVTIQAPTIVASTQTATVCPGEFLTLSATGGISYSWSNGAGQNTPFVPMTSSFVTATQSYVVNGFDIDGCANQDTVVVTVIPQPILNPGMDQTICEGTPVILYASTTPATATAVSSYVWNNNVANNAQFVPTTSTVVTVVATGANGCTTQDSVQITVLALPTVNAGVDQTICAGTGATLIASGAVSYEWNNNVSQGVPFYPTSSQIYTVTGIGTNGCTNVDQVQVNVATGPSVTVSAPQTVCSNDAATFSAVSQNSLGGFWTTSGNGTITPSISSAAITYLPAANDPVVVTLTYVATNACGNASSTTNVNVLPIPVVDAGPDQTICSGSSVVLNAAGTGNITWGTSNVNNGFAFIPVSTATYTATATSLNNCTNQDEVTVTVVALPDVNAGDDVTICSGEQVTLTASGAITYEWSGGIANGTSFAPGTTATYTVTGTTVNGCSSTDQVIVTVNATPEAIASIVDDVTLTATPGVYNYQWINCATGTAVPNASFATFNALANGTYAVIVSTPQGCSDQSDCITIDAVSIDQITELAMSVQPNPTSGELSISMPTDLTAQAQVFDAQGKLVIDLTSVSNGSTLNLSNMTTGVYMIRITAAESLQTFRVVKQ